MSLSFRSQPAVAADQSFVIIDGVSVPVSQLTRSQKINMGIPADAATAPPVLYRESTTFRAPSQAPPIQVQVPPRSTVTINRPVPAPSVSNANLGQNFAAALEEALAAPSAARSVSLNPEVEIVYDDVPIAQQLPYSSPSALNRTSVPLRGLFSGVGPVRPVVQQAPRTFF